ncbi:MAG TPA: hypothetical protein VHN77_00545 [Phycisphaerales bacterium]|nr:hypothetical protein [Phycisphaerales bacterium]
MQESHREKAFGKPQGSHLWCLHCERTYEHGKWRVVDGMQMCPYADCDGDAVIDAWDWATFREQNHPQYPAVPVFGTVYPAYPK